MLYRRGGNRAIATMGKGVIFHCFWRLGSFKRDFLSHFWVNSISFWTHQNPLSLRIQKMSLLFQIGPPKEELWPFKHLKHSFWTSCQNGGKTFLFYFYNFFSSKLYTSPRYPIGGRTAAKGHWSAAVRSLNTLFKKGRCSGCIASKPQLSFSQEVRFTHIFSCFARLQNMQCKM